MPGLYLVFIEKAKRLTDRLKMSHFNSLLLRPCRCTNNKLVNQPFWNQGCTVYCLYLWDSEDTTTTRAGAERSSTSCRHWTSRKWPRWQIWNVDSRPSSVRLQGWVHTAALHTRMCRGLLEEGKKIKDVWLFIDYKWKQRRHLSFTSEFSYHIKLTRR